MGKGELSGTVRLKRSALWGGFDRAHEDIPNVSADMELEGKYVRFYVPRKYGLEDRLKHDTKTEVSIKIEFTEKQKIPKLLEHEAESYIGNITLIDHRKTDPSWAELVEISIIIDITLPLNMFYQLSLWEGKNITFHTFQDIFENPIEMDEGGFIVANVKSVLFEIEHKPTS